MENTAPEHEKLFDEISNKLNELSQRDDSFYPQSSRIEKMQSQIKKFHSELQGTQDEFRNKIKSLENVHIASSEINSQIKMVSDQLNSERNINTKLNADLVKAHEISLQLQLEIQSLKTRAVQIQNEEKKYSHALGEKLKMTMRDLELTQALKEELAIEVEKLKNQLHIERESQNSNVEIYVKQISEKDISLLEKDRVIVELETMLNDKNLMIKEKEEIVQSKESCIEELGKQIENMSLSLNEIEEASIQQNEAMKNLMSVAENKIVELKMALDKKNIESQDYYSHLQQTMTQYSLIKQENTNLKEYINKISLYIQQQQQSHQQAQQLQNQAIPSAQKELN